MTQTGGRCHVILNPGDEYIPTITKTICQLCGMELSGDKPIIHWYRKPDKTNMLLNKDPHINQDEIEYCFHVMCLLSLVLYDANIEEHTIIDHNRTMPSTFDANCVYNIHHGKKWYLNQIRFYMNPILTQLECEKIIEIGYQEGLIRKHPLHPRRITTNYKLSYWFDADTLQHVPTRRSVDTTIKNLINEIELKINSSIEGQYKQIYDNIKNTFKTDDSDYQFYNQVISNTTINNKLNLLDLIDNNLGLNDENFNLLIKIIDAFKKINSKTKIKNILFYLSANEIININPNPDVSMLRSDIRIVGSNMMSNKLNYLLRDNHNLNYPLITEYINIFKDLVNQIPNTLDLQKKLNWSDNYTFELERYSLNELIYVPFKNTLHLLSGITDLEAEHGQHTQSGGICNMNDSDIVDPCLICNKPLTESGMLNPHVVGTRYPIVHIESDGNQIIDIGCDQDQYSENHKFTYCYHLECILHLIQSDLSSTPPRTPVCPLNGIPIDQHWIKYLLDCGVEYDLIFYRGIKNNKLQYTNIRRRSDIFEYPYPVPDDYNYDLEKINYKLKLMFNKCHQICDPIVDIIRNEHFEKYSSDYIDNVNCPQLKNIDLMNKNQLKLDNKNKIFEILPDSSYNYKLFKELIYHFQNSHKNASRLAFYAAYDQTWNSPEFEETIRTIWSDNSILHIKSRSKDIYNTYMSLKDNIESVFNSKYMENYPNKIDPNLLLTDISKQYQTENHRLSEIVKKYFRYIGNQIAEDQYGYQDENREYFDRSDYI